MRGHQPFFLAAASFAVLAIALWLGVLEQVGPSPNAPAPVHWHAHEMLFGYTVAVLAGFLLIGSSGWRVAVLLVLWVAGRVAVTWAGPSALVAALDLTFAPALALLRVPPLWAGFKWPTVGFLPLLGALFAANLLWHLDALGIAPGGAERSEMLALDLVTLMIVVMAGRLVPGYTRAMLIKLRRPKDPARERWSVALALGLLVADQLGWRDVFGATALALGAVQAWRLAGWRSAVAARRPILLVLHLGFAWLAVGLLLRGTAALAGWLSTTDAIHATTIGAVGTLTLGMMGRLARTHSRRTLSASAVDVASYAMLLAAAVARAVVPAVAPDARHAAYVAAALIWAAAFALFLVEHGRALGEIRAGGSGRESAASLRQVNDADRGAA